MKETEGVRLTNDPRSVAVDNAQVDGRDAEDSLLHVTSNNATLSTLDNQDCTVMISEVNAYNEVGIPCEGDDSSCNVTKAQYNQLSVSDIIGHHDWNRFRGEYGKGSWNVTHCLRYENSPLVDNNSASLSALNDIIVKKKKKNTTIDSLSYHTTHEASVINYTHGAKLSISSGSEGRSNDSQYKPLLGSNHKTQKSLRHALRKNKVLYNSKHIHNMPLHIERNWMYNYNQGKRKFKSNIYWGQMKLTEAMQLTAEEFQPNRTLTCVVVKLLHDIQDKLLAASPLATTVMKVIMQSIYVDHDGKNTKLVSGVIQHTSLSKKHKLVDDGEFLRSNLQRIPYAEQWQQLSDDLKVTL